MKNFILSFLALMLFVGLEAQEDKKVIIISKNKDGEWVKTEKNSDIDSEIERNLIIRNDSEVQVFHNSEWHENENRQLIREQYQKAFLGVVPQGRWGEKGFFVSRVVEGSGADEGGLKKGDCVLDIDGIPTDGDNSLGDALTQFEPGQQVTLNVQRNGQSLQLPVTLGQRTATRTIFNDKRDPCDVFIGVYTTNNSNGEGVRVNSIIGNTPAEQSAVKPGDVILELNGMPTNDTYMLRRERDKNNPGDEFTLLVERNGTAMDILARFKTCDDEPVIQEEVVEELEEIELIEEVEINVQEEEVVLTPLRKTKEEAVTPPTPLMEDSGLLLELDVWEAYPNPSFGNINIRFQADPVPTTIRVLNISGKEIFKQQINNFDGIYQKEFNLGRSPGTLLFSVQQGDKVVTKKLVIMDRS